MTGVRIMRCCSKCKWRAIGEAAAVCPEHGKTATFTDFNSPYMGKPVAQAPGFDQAAYEKGAAARAKIAI